MHRITVFRAVAFVLGVIGALATPLVAVAHGHAHEHETTEHHAGRLVAADDSSHHASARLARVEGGEGDHDDHAHAQLGAALTTKSVSLSVAFLAVPVTLPFLLVVDTPRAVAVEAFVAPHARHGPPARVRGPPSLPA